MPLFDVVELSVCFTPIVGDGKTGGLFTQEANEDDILSRRQTTNEV
jgi:hypothetical protein